MVDPEIRSIAIARIVKERWNAAHPTLGFAPLARRDQVWQQFEREAAQAVDAIADMLPTSQRYRYLLLETNEIFRITDTVGDVPVVEPMAVDSDKVTVQRTWHYKEEWRDV